MNSAFVCGMSATSSYDACGRVSADCRRRRAPPRHSEQAESPSSFWNRESTWSTTLCPCADLFCPWTAFCCCVSSNPPWNPATSLSTSRRRVGTGRGKSAECTSCFSTTPCPCPLARVPWAWAALSSFSLPESVHRRSWWPRHTPGDFLICFCIRLFDVGCFSCPDHDSTRKRSILLSWTWSSESSLAARTLVEIAPILATSSIKS